MFSIKNGILEPKMQGIWPMPKINFFSKCGHVAYQIKWNDAYNNTLANILPLHNPWGGVKRSTFFSFLKVVMLHIKVTGTNHRTPSWEANILPFYTPSIPGVSQKP